MHSPYLDQIYETLPRILALFDSDPSSESYGMGDRFYWAWGLIDFGNGTFQGAANGLARLLVNDLLPEGYSKDKIIRRIDAMFIGADKLRRIDGSMEEAFPYEGSFCVTALVAYDLLTAIELLYDYLDNEVREKYIDIVRPMIGFILKNNETHAFISNHLATAVAALYKWNLLTGESSCDRAEEILNKILTAQSEEGWYREYEGADPGYQTLCTYYLADILRMQNNDRLRDSLTQSIHFLWHFAHPDGSFGGLYGSRNTRFYYPGGIEYLKDIIPEAAALAKFMRKSILEKKVVTLSSMDEPNLIPMFNSYCWAASIEGDIIDTPQIPCLKAQPFRIFMAHAGILIDHSERHHTIISTRKGGVVYHFKDGHLDFINSGLLFTSKNGKLYSTQSTIDTDNVVIGDNEIVIKSEIRAVTRQLPKPWQFLILRLLCITFMRIRRTREYFKKMLVTTLITGIKKSYGTNTRRIKLGPDLTIHDEPRPMAGLKQQIISSPFYTIHMASQGYWQSQDDR